MEVTHLNIVSLNVPYPPDYGGVIDIYYKIKALHNLGINIYLHCFKYGRDVSEDLTKYCNKVFYYKRKTGLVSNVSLLPYIINSRRNYELLVNLQQNNYPILFEGLHTTYYLIKKKLSNRVTAIRFHNIEHDYYRYLAKNESNMLRKIYFYKEAMLLNRMLTHIPENVIMAAISPSDHKFLEEKFTSAYWLPPFHPNSRVEVKSGRGDYVLYHGNLSVSENITVAIDLIKEFRNKELQLIIAGKEPSKKILDLVSSAGNIQLVANPEASAMNKLINNAHIILLLTYQPTGIKLKLIESMYKGRFCIANEAMIKNTCLESLCILAKPGLYSQAEEIMKLSFTDADISKRNQVLDRYYHVENNARLLIDKLSR